jgi:chemotaxis protein CheC
VLSSSDSIRLANVLTGQNVDKIDSLDEMALSALKEVGNILTGSYVRVLAQELKVRIAYSVPGFANDMLGAVLDEILARLSLEAEHAVIMESEFTVRDEVYRSHLIFILSPDSVSTIIKALGSWKK